MDAVIQFLSQRWDEIVSVITDLNLGDILDIIIVAFLIYKAILLVRETRAAQLVKGIVIMLVVFAFVKLFKMDTMSWLIDRIWDFAVFAVLIVFQPELRRILEQMGRSKINVLGHNMSVDEAEQINRKAIEATCKACVSMSASKIGALIAFERKTMLGEVIATGRVVDAEISSDLICNIFYPKAPLHDGGMIIRYGKIQAAACIFPLTQKDEINRELGTRHRAAIGMSENSDAIIVVVSEETGNISIASNGVLTRNYNAISLKEELEKALIGEEVKEAGVKKLMFWKRWFK